MDRTSDSLTSTEFFQRLQEDKLSPPVRLIGMVKKPAEGQSAIAFAFGTRCALWVNVPLDLIEKVEVLKTQPCGDHNHPLVKLFLAPPVSSEGRIFYGLLEGLVSSLGNGAVDVSARNCREGGGTV